MATLTFMFSSEFEDDPDLYVLKPLKYIGIEVWQVMVASLFIYLMMFALDCCLMSIYVNSG